ncbi:MAG TPA: PD-(D/E)XK nuclease family protein [Mycobacteriales bacterium]|nr:PD-(D/E)XK nuclease family protein [Mycobacteriales bacterium]
MAGVTLVQRPDLSRRTGLSKSTLVGFDMCASRSWFDIHDRRPLMPMEKITFGSALDAAIEQILTAVRAGLPAADAHPLEAAEEVIARDGVDVDIAEVDRAASAFLRDVLPHFDFALCGLQLSLHEALDGIGETEGHPDVRLADGSIFDVKSSARAKPADAAATSVELGLYALLSEAESGEPCPRVGYWTWCRTSKPYWQVLETPVTDEMRRRTREVARAYVRAKAADELLNRGQDNPINFSMTSGPKSLGLCGTCSYSPANGGPCLIAVQGEVSDAA